MKLTVTKVSGENYCGKKSVSLELSERSIIRGKNKTGKTTVGNMIADPLTGKTMNGSEIDSRPKDENGSAIDHIETKAEVDILVDGTPYTLTKVTRQKWVKNRGESEAKFTGYSNELAISGVPKKQKDYETFLTDLIAPADVRVRCMIPQATLSLDMKKRRERLMAMAEDVTDEVVIKKYPEYKELADDLKFATPDELMARGRKVVKTKNTELLQIPARVDSLNSMRVQVDEEAVKKAEDTINEVSDKMKQYKAELAKLRTEEVVISGSITDESAKLSSRRKEVMKEAMDKTAAYRDDLDAKVDALNEVNNEIAKVGITILNCKSIMADAKADIDTLKAEQKAAKAQKMSAKSLKCPTCGREYDKADRDKIKAKFEQDKADKVASINSKGNTLVERFNSYKKQLEEANSKLKELTTAQKNLEVAVTKAKKEMPRSSDVDFSKDKTCVDIEKKITKLKAEFTANHKKQDDVENCITLLRETEAEAKKYLLTIETTRDVNKSVDDKIEGLKMSQRILGQEIANEERIIELLKSFQMTKINMVTDKVNQNFDMVKWVMFKEQVNGAYAPICEPTVNGVSYYSTLNHSDKILAEVDICLGFQKAAGVNLPIIIDDSESVDADRIPKMDRQLIILRRTDDDSLTVVTD